MTHCLIKNMYANKLFEIGIIYYFLYVMFFWELGAVASNLVNVIIWLSKMNTIPSFEFDVQATQSYSD